MHVEVGACKLMRGKKLQRMFRKKWAQVAHLFSIKASDQREEHFQTISPKSPQQIHELTLLDSLLNEYQDLFVEPKVLPP